MSTSQTKRKSLRAALAARELIVAPGAYDAITARLIEQAGFAAVYMTGAGASAARGYPDYGLLTLSEMAESAGAIARSIDVPLISDADTGYGNVLNVTRTVREFEQRGVAAVHIEDQVSPKRCGHLDDKEVVSREEFSAKIRAAVAARTDADFVVIARTDAGAVMGPEEALIRANLALAAGADMAFVEAVQSLEQMAAVPREVKGPCLLNLVAGGKTPAVSIAEAGAMGYQAIILPGILIFEVVEALDRVLQAVRQTGRPPVPAASIRNIFQRFGSDAWDAVRQDFDTIAGA
jgi:2-methylisocitrate lyase-like PEP mutase family enzyme